MSGRIDKPQGAIFMYRKLDAKDLLCTGCGACVNKCANDAIEYIYNYENDGSMVAQINEEKCVSCHLCETVCPVLTEHSNENQVVDECYAVWANDEVRMQSSSGGVFTVLAEEMLDRGGYVCAVAYGSNFKAEHIIISDKKELYKLRRSKYMQSDVGFVYRRVEELLKRDKEVMFVGTPCQVAGIKAYLGQTYKKLLLVDIYCNYTPAYPLFEKYLNENYNVNNIEKIEFRIKKYGWFCDIHEVTYKSGKIEEKREYNDDFQRGYHSKLFLRETCEKCKFAGNPRQGDLSIADFWHIGEFCSELDDAKGTSCVVVNNANGACFFEKTKEVLSLCRKVPIDWMQYNRGATTKPHLGRNRLYNLIKNRTFHEAVDYALNEKYDVAIWGNWSEKNYGSELTYYALYKVICELGYDPLMVERPKNAVWAPNESPVLFRESPYSEDSVHPLYPDKVSMYELNEKCGTFIVGSDQIWHRNLYNDFGKVAFLDYIYNDKKKIAYASSFGREYWTGNAVEAQEVSFYLKNFDYISVREQSGVQVCKKYFDVKAQWVLDPVFLCNKENYRKLAEQANGDHAEKYIGGYILDIDDKKLNIIQNLRESLNLPCTILTDAFRDSLIENENIDIQKNRYCEDWIENIMNSTFVITDSFHGMCFSIIFNKPFIVICNEERGKIRFTDLLGKLDLLDRLITENVEKERIDLLIWTPIDYSHVNQILKEKKVYSLQWLKDALESKKDYKMTEYDLLLRKFQEAERRSYKFQEKIPYIERELGNRKWDISVHRKELNERTWDIQVHRKELDEHQKLLGERLWDIQVHRKELDEHKKEIENLKQKQDKLEKQINNIENCWIFRIWNKIRRLVKRR